MKKKLITTVLFLVLLVAVFALCSCNKDKSKANYDYLVTFDYNIKSLNATLDEADQLDELTQQFLGAKKDSLIVAPGNDSHENLSQYFQEKKVRGYYVEGWYLAEIGEDGEVVLTTKWNFATDVVTENITLYANFVKRPTLTLDLAGLADDIVYDTYVPGNSLPKPSSSFEPKVSGYTFVGYYTDNTCTQPYSWPHVFTGEDATIYVKFIQGDWRIINQGDVVNFKFALGANLNIYLNDDLDFSDNTWAYNSNYTGELNGNGHKITNINCEIDLSGRNPVENIALFGKIGATANIHDVEIENAILKVNDNYNVPHEITVSLFACEIVDGAQLTNVKVGGTATFINKSGDKLLDVILTEPVCGNQAAVDLSQFTGCDFTEITTEDATE